MPYRPVEAAVLPRDPDWFNERAANWLKRAEEIRALAETMRALEMRLVLEHIAVSYEQLAELVAKQKDGAARRHIVASATVRPKR